MSYNGGTLIMENSDSLDIKEEELDDYDFAQVNVKCEMSDEENSENVPEVNPLPTSFANHSVPAGTFTNVLFLQNGTAEKLNETSTHEYRPWSHEQTLKLLEVYAKIRPKVGSVEIRSMKKLWDVICYEINTHFVNQRITPSNCENKWRVLERNYRKYLKNPESRVKKRFLYAAQMSKLSRSEAGSKPVLEPVPSPAAPSVIIKLIPEKAASKHDVFEKRRSHRKRMRKAKLMFRKKQRNLKLNYLQKRIELEERKLEEKVRKNNLFEERNQLLQKLLESGVALPPVQFY